MRTRDERGTAALELVLVIPCLVLLLGAMVAGGRLWFAQTDVTEAAYVAARAASLARSAPEATREGRRAGAEALSDRDRRCTESFVALDAGGFQVPVGKSATVTARLTCRVPLADLLVPGLPGSIVIARDGVSALDTYRART